MMRTRQGEISTTLRAVSTFSPRAALPALLFAALLGAVPSAGAQETEETAWKAPRIGGHTFSPSSAIPDALVRSYIRNELGIAQTHELEIPLAVIDGDTIRGERGKLLFAVLDLEYQQTIKDWIAVRGQFKVVGRLGTSTSALLSTGVSASTGFRLGWLIRLLEMERGYLSASFDVSNSDFTTINILDFVGDVIEGEDAELVRKTPSLRAGGGLRYTHAFSPLFGVKAFGETGYGESVDRESDDEWYFKFGGSLDFDLAGAGWLPIGLAAGYMQDSFPEGGADIVDVTRAFHFRVGYTGRRDFALGLNYMFQTFPTKNTDRNIKSSGLTLDLRYYF